MTMMLAAVVKVLGKGVSIERVPVPVPQEGEVLVQIQASGVCHTDLHAADGDWPVKPTVPFIPGHEGVGRIVQLGPGVRDLKMGDRVGIPWLHDACGRCEHCLSGWETLCEAQNDSGYSVNGGFAEYAIARADFAAPIPEGLSSVEAAPILCAGVTTYKGLKATGARPGQWIAISGIGGLGHLAVQYARAMGLHVAAIDVSTDKLELARVCGAEVLIDARDGDVGAAVQKAIGGAHASLVTAVSTSAFAAGLGVLRRGGTAVLVGLPPGDFPLPIFEVVLKGLTVRGSIVGTRLDVKEALAFAADGAVRATIERASLDRLPDVFERLRKGNVSGRVVLEMPPT